MKFLIALTLSLLSTPAFAERAAPLKYDTLCILKAVLKKKKLEFRADLAVPPLYVESQTPLAQFQDAVEPQWKMRPDGFLNVYIVAKNEIYVMDRASYYEKVGRFVDDSLAHELTHYVQVMYQNTSLDDQDAAEYEAVDVQTWFRETYMQTGKSPCAD